ncbi:hypothetical protein AMAG_09411 [Allomyces macrogynus ATCC 38327]|uniref:Uncharacterized protein n=1 Tax=Allomyces macrogynus (strain ATCC 38327) TaxID=578462 RepID=A0A0L0SPH9_ALLM3|nr:hypothetical protein AMAG_09411 [Allomyces macrogynus ATCC 38327]|eukprot:KNE64387.1 hypothetical protein AMAG_09411 [Allomyces macrogynus ATCC 38327]
MHPAVQGAVPLPAVPPPAAPPPDEPKKLFRLVKNAAGLTVQFEFWESGAPPDGDIFEKDLPDYDALPERQRPSASFLGSHARAKAKPLGFGAFRLNKSPIAPHWRRQAVARSVWYHAHGNLVKAKQVMDMECNAAAKSLIESINLLLFPDFVYEARVSDTAALVTVVKYPSDNPSNVTEILNITPRPFPGSDYLTYALTGSDPRKVIAVLQDVYTVGKRGSELTAKRKDVSTIARAKPWFVKWRDQYFAQTVCISATKTPPLKAETCDKTLDELLSRYLLAGKPSTFSNVTRHPTPLLESVIVTLEPSFSSCALDRLELESILCKLLDKKAAVAAHAVLQTVDLSKLSRSANVLFYSHFRQNTPVVNRLVAIGLGIRISPRFKRHWTLAKDVAQALIELDHADDLDDVDATDSGGRLVLAGDGSEADADGNVVNDDPADSVCAAKMAELDASDHALLVAFFKKFLIKPEHQAQRTSEEADIFMDPSEAQTLLHTLEVFPAKYKHLVTKTVEAVHRVNEHERAEPAKCGFIIRFDDVGTPLTLHPLSQARVELCLRGVLGLHNPLDTEPHLAVASSTVQRLFRALKPVCALFGRSFDLVVVETCAISTSSSFPQRYIRNADKEDPIAKRWWQLGTQFYHELGDVFEEDEATRVVVLSQLVGMKIGRKVPAVVETGMNHPSAGRMAGSKGLLGMYERFVDLFGLTPALEATGMDVLRDATERNAWPQLMSLPDDDKIRELTGLTDPGAIALVIMLCRLCGDRQVTRELARAAARAERAAAKAAKAAAVNAQGKKRSEEMIHETSESWSATVAAAAATPTAATGATAADAAPTPPTSPGFTAAATNPPPEFPMPAATPTAAGATTSAVAPTPPSSPGFTAAAINPPPEFPMPAAASTTATGTSMRLKRMSRVSPAVSPPTYPMAAPADAVAPSRFGSAATAANGPTPISSEFTAAAGSSLAVKAKHARRPFLASLAVPTPATSSELLAAAGTVPSNSAINAAALDAQATLMVGSSAAAAAATTQSTQVYGDSALASAPLDVEGAVATAAMAAGEEDEWTASDEEFEKMFGPQLAAAHAKLDALDTLVAASLLIAPPPLPSPSFAQTAPPTLPSMFAPPPPSPASTLSQKTATGATKRPAPSTVVLPPPSPARAVGRWTPATPTATVPPPQLPTAVAPPPPPPARAFGHKTTTGATKRARESTDMGSASKKMRN